MGKLLAADLDDTDTLGRWMAHYIASLIASAQDAPDDQREEQRQHCFDEILKLWRHRASMPGPDRPLESFDPIFRALERIDPKRPAWTRFRSMKQNGESGGPAASLLEAAVALEDSAVRGMRSLFKEALAMAAGVERKWIEAAPEPGEEDVWALLLDNFDIAVGANGKKLDDRSIELKATIRSLDEAIRSAEDARRALQGRLDHGRP